MNMYERLDGSESEPDSVGLARRMKNYLKEVERLSRNIRVSRDQKKRGDKETRLKDLRERLISELDAKLAEQGKSWVGEVPDLPRFSL